MTPANGGSAVQRRPFSDSELTRIDVRLRCVELARSYGGRDVELLDRARAIAAFVLGDQSGGEQVQAVIRAADQRMPG